MGNSGTLTVRVGEERRQRFDTELDSSEAESESELLRELIDLGLDARGQGLYRRLGCTDKLAAKIEESREPGESKQKAVARLLRKAVESRDSDHTEKLLRDDLRDRVEALAGEGEPIDDAARRLLRGAVEEEEAEGSWIKQRAGFTALMLFLTGVPALAARYGTADGALFTVIFITLIFVFGEDINRFTEWFLKRVGDGVRRVKP